ncbi:MAG: cation diffusion facilitator family transporter [Butyrivibrio sp.]|nr:cation diffusion facilitator family transporter [Butyrivibrio sp.]
MICLLARFFIKDYEKTNLPKVRQGYGVISGASGVALNVLLFLTKFFASLISGSISILGDALNNLSDAASSIVTLVGFKLSGQAADEEHPFGHGRIEYVAGLIVSLLIILTGIELIHSSFTKIFHPEPTTFNAVVAFILIFSIIIKLIMFQGNLQAAGKIESAALKSTAIDSISDVFTTSIVLISAVVSFYMKIYIDGFIGVVVGGLIVKAGVDAARDTINPLLGEPPSKETLEEIESVVKAHNGVLGVHDIVVHNYGPSRIFMSLHVEVPSRQDLITVHDLIDDIENELRKKYHCTAVIHMDPVEVNASIAELKRKIGHVLKELDPNLTFHDFRMIHSENQRKKLAFDVVVPFKYDLSEDEIKTYLYSHIKDIDPELTCDIEIDYK